MIEPFDLPVPPAAGQRVDHLTDTEVDLVLRTAERSYLNPFVVMALYTGGRPGEIVTADFRQVDRRHDTISYTSIKGNGKARTRLIDLHPRVTAMLDALPHQSGRIVRDRLGRGYPDPARLGRTGSITAPLRYEWGKIIEAAGLSRPVAPYVLRHTFATRLRWAGAELDELKELLGHESIEQTQVYAHIKPGRKQSLVLAVK